MFRTNHAVLSGGELPANYIDACELALSRHLTSVWVPDGNIEPSIPGGDYSIQVAERHKRIATVSVWKRGTGRQPINIIFPANTAWKETLKGVEAVTMLMAISYVEQVLGIPVTGSPGSMGWSLVVKIHPEWVEALPVDLRELHFTSHAGGDLVWQADNIAELVRGIRYVVKFDRNASYPSAATQTDIGVGTPVHVDHGDDARHEKGHPQAVGVWHCSVKYMGYDPALPPVWSEHRRPVYDGWLSGPIIRLLRAFGHEVVIHEGYVFPERHDLLVKWATFLWDARAALSDRSRFSNDLAARIAIAMTKQVANATIGFTAFKGFDEDEEEKRRPDIRLQVVSRNRELVSHNIRKFYKLYGIAPVMVYTDAIYYLSDQADPRSLWPEIAKRETLLGGYKFVGSIEITPDVQAMFSRDIGVADRLEFLNQKGWIR